MKLEKIILSQAIRLGKIAGKEGGSVYGRNLTRLCESKYGFLEGPRALADYDLSKGVTFIHGYFNEEFVIDKFQVFENGLFVEAKIDTDKCEQFLDDVTKWAVETGGFTFAQNHDTPRLFLSNIEVLSTRALGKTFLKISDFGKEIANAMRSYGHVTPDWELSGITYGNGGTNDVASFKFEQREGNPPPKDVYFSSSRLRTKDHLALLEKLASLL